MTIHPSHRILSNVYIKWQNEELVLEYLFDPLTSVALRQSETNFILEILLINAFYH